MAITTNAICNSFKGQILRAIHNFNTSGAGGNTFKLALYQTDATLGASTTSFTTTQQVSSAGYVSGGKALVNSGVLVTGAVAFTNFSNVSFTGVTLTAQGALIYNDTAAGDPAVCVLDFGGPKTATAGTFTVQFPAFQTDSAIIRIGNA
jgi:hypothetical protein